MKIDKNLRNLLLSDDKTVMIDRSSCMYMGKKYTFKPVTRDEMFERADNLMKLLDERSWAKQLVDRLFNKNE